MFEPPGEPSSVWDRSAVEATSERTLSYDTKETNQARPLVKATAPTRVQANGENVGEKREI
jgi:hypothetical protein